MSNLTTTDPVQTSGKEVSTVSYCKELSQLNGTKPRTESRVLQIFRLKLSNVSSIESMYTIHFERETSVRSRGG